MDIKGLTILLYLFINLLINTCVTSSAIRPQDGAGDTGTILDRLVFREELENDNNSVAESPLLTYDRNVNPLKDQPNLSNPLPGKKNKVIRGSRKAVTLTKMEYLRKDWCKTDLFTQIVREPGCQKRQVLNRFCYGQCNSFFVPKFSKSNAISAAFQSCTVCAPRKWSWVTVTLRCSGSQKRKRKRVQVVKQCKCMSKTVEDKLRKMDRRT